MTDDEKQISLLLSGKFELNAGTVNSLTALTNMLATTIEYLLQHDVDKLLRLLYQIDVSEKSIKINLKENQQDAALGIAQLIILRQLEKIQTRKNYKQQNDIPEDEKW